MLTLVGAGCIFLLHGPPGCGKTLTAEAIAEMLHRPLYSISVGELGTQTATLETKLRDILEVASAWDSVILIDEADIFLEKRVDSDIEVRVGCYMLLNLLEKCYGWSFLKIARISSRGTLFDNK